MDLFFAELVNTLSSFSNELISLMEFGLCATFLLFMLRIGGFSGIYVFNVVATIVGNLQVLREVDYFFQFEKVALGSIVFAMSFAGSDIITEHYGKGIAKTGVMLTFISHILFVIIILLLLTYKPFDDPYYRHLQSIFITSPRFLVSSIIAYTCSQLIDIYVFSTLKQYCINKNFLWLRSITSLTLASLADNVIFSVIAWKILNPEHISMEKLIFTYIFGTYWFKLLINASTVFLIYLSYKVIKKS